MSKDRKTVEELSITEDESAQFVARMMMWADADSSTMPVFDMVPGKFLLHCSLTV